MTNQNFVDRMEQFARYSDDFEHISLFEITQYFSSNLFLVIIFFLSLPLFFVSTQYLIIPLSAFNIIFFIWYYFDQKVIIPDFIKKITISSAKIKKMLIFTSLGMRRFQQWTGSQNTHFLAYWHYLMPLSVAFGICAEFQLGFVPDGSLWPACSLLFITPGLLLRNGPLTLLGYLCFFIGLL